MMLTLPVDLALTWLAGEALLLAWIARRPGEPRRAALALVPGLIAGVGLLGALRLAVVGLPAAAADGVPLWWLGLALGGVGHALDLWRRRPSSSHVRPGAVRRSGRVSPRPTD